jgi:hypothetical protein
MAKSDFAQAVDRIQLALKPLLRGRGFKVRGRTFNCTTDDGLTQVVNIQMGSSDPPGTTYIPGLREDMHGLFTVNLGVYVPEVARHHMGGEARTWIQDYHCCVRARLGETDGEGQHTWWRAQMSDSLVGELGRGLQLHGFPFLDRFSSRDKILSEWHERSENFSAGSPPRIVMAIILVERGHKDRARELLAQQVLEALNPGHPDYVRELAIQLGLGSVDE